MVGGYSFFLCVNMIYMDLKDIKSQVLSRYRISSYGPSVIESEDGAKCPYCGSRLKTCFDEKLLIWQTQYCDNSTCKRFVEAEMSLKRILIDNEHKIRELQLQKEDTEALLKDNLFNHGIMTDNFISNMEDDAKNLRESYDLQKSLSN